MLGQERPDRCERWRVEVSGLAEDLGVKIDTRRGMTGRARWQRVRRVDPLREASLWSEGPREIDVIQLRPELRESTRRFALAHELGHVIMHRRHRRLASLLSPSEHEQFANAFANELLLPRSHRAELIKRFCGVTEPVEMLRLSDSLGVSPQTLLRSARRENWLEGLDHGWIDIRVLPNRHTGKDRRPRVYYSTFDRSRWFLPSNRSVAGAFGGDEWLVSAELEVAHAERTLRISSCREHVVPRFVQTLLRTHLAALRLYRTRAPYGMEFLARARLLTGSAEPCREGSSADSDPAAQLALF
jgi:hypothetical protein